MNRCIEDAKSKGKHGLTVISSPKKRGFLSDPKYLSYKGFKVADTAKPYFTLLYYPFEEAAVPAFREQVKIPHIEKEGFVLYYTCGCPFTAKYVPVIENAAKEQNIPFESIRIESCEAAQNGPAAWTNYALFYNGAYITNEILSEKKFHSLCEELMLERV